MGCGYQWHLKRPPVPPPPARTHLASLNPKHCIKASILLSYKTRALFPFRSNALSDWKWRYNGAAGVCSLWPLPLQNRQTWRDVGAFSDCSSSWSVYWPVDPVCRETPLDRCWRAQCVCSGLSYLISDFNQQNTQTNEYNHEHTYSQLYTSTLGKPELAKVGSVHFGANVHINHLGLWHVRRMGLFLDWYAAPGDMSHVTVIALSHTKQCDSNFVAIEAAGYFTNSCSSRWSQVCLNTIVWLNVADLLWWSSDVPNWCSLSLIYSQTDIVVPQLLALNPQHTYI